MNLITLIGRLGQEPKITVTKSDFTIAEFSIATNDTKKTQDGYEKITDWHNVKCLGKTAELVDKYLDKGSNIAIVGRLKTDTWENDEGKKQYKTYVLCDKLEFLGSKGDGASQPKQESKELDLSDIPF